MIETILVSIFASSLTIASIFFLASYITNKKFKKNSIEKFDYDR